MQHKQLPPNPSLEHLKSQAKQLLKAHKEGSLDAFQRIRVFFPKRSDATDTEIQNAAFGLQNAQLVIAREYGFATWTRLKEEVKFRYDVVQNLKVGEDESHTCERSPLFLPGTNTFASETVSHTYEMSPLLVAIGTWYGIREAVEALDECLEVVAALIEAGADVHRNYRVDIDGEILELTPLTYTQKLASLFPDKPFERMLDVLLADEAAQL